MTVEEGAGGGRPRTPEEGETLPRTVPEWGTFEFTGVEMVRGPAPLSLHSAELVVLFDDGGVTITGQDPDQRQVLPWADVRHATIGDPTAGAAGTTVTPVEIETSGTTVQLLLDEDRDHSVPIDALARCIGRWAPAGGMGHRAVAAAPSPPVAGEPTEETAETGEPTDETEETETEVIEPAEGTEEVTEDAEPASPPAALTPGATAAGPPAPGAMPPVEGSAPTRPAGPHRVATLLVGIALIGTAVGLAVTLAGQSRGRSPAVATTVQPSGPDQRLASGIMLTRADMPVGWQVASKPTVSANSAQIEHGQAAITRAFAGCMGVSDQQAAVVLGGQASDQTAQASSPIFVAPTTGDADGSTLQLQTAASVVRTHHDEQIDLGLFANHRYPTCAAVATASELQLGVDDASGTHDSPKAATGTLFALPAKAGEQVNALRVTCQVVSHGTMVPVEVEAVFLGSGRIEADLEAFDINGGIPPAVVLSSMQAFEQRVAAKGKGVQI